MGNLIKKISNYSTLTFLFFLLNACNFFGKVKEEKSEANPYFIEEDAGENSLSHATASTPGDMKAKGYLLQNPSLRLDENQKKRMRALTSIFENGTTKAQYDYIENIHDGRGYTAGFIGFCTGTQDLVTVVREYFRLKGQNDSCLNLYTNRLEELELKPSASTQGLDGFPACWKSTAKDPLFVRAQENIAEKTYYYPALKKADKLGLKLPLSLAVFYDTAVMQGLEGNDSLSKVIQRTISEAGLPNEGLNEIDWMKKFLTVRYRILKNASHAETASAWEQNADRATILQKLFDKESNLTLNNPISSKNRYSDEVI